MNRLLVLPALSLIMNVVRSRVLKTIISHFMIDFQMRFGYQFIVYYALAMTSTAIAMLIGSSVEDTKVAVEFLPVLIVPQIMFAGFFIATKLIPVWLRQVSQSAAPWTLVQVAPNSLSIMLSL